MTVAGTDQPTLVIGGSGFLGRAVVRRLDGSQHHPVVTTRSGSSGAIGCDVGDPSELARLLEDVRPSAIVNCAVIPDFGPGTLARQYSVNVLAPGLMARYCADTDAHLIQASASLVYGARTARIEDVSPIAPDTDYGRAKHLAEELIAASGCRAAVLRLCGLYGVGGPAHLGLNRAIEAARQGVAPQIDGKGVAKRNYLHIDDAAAVIEHVLRQKMTGVWRVASDEIRSIAEIMTVVCRAFLPGCEPLYRDGPEAQDQIIIPSPGLPKTRPMSECLAPAGS